jgi:hypothetical protein
METKLKPSFDEYQNSRTGPYTAVREVTLSLVNERGTERLEVSIGQPNG